LAANGSTESTGKAGLKLENRFVYEGHGQEIVIYGLIERTDLNDENREALDRAQVIPIDGKTLRGSMTGRPNRVRSQ